MSVSHSPVIHSHRPTWEDYLLHPVDSCRTVIGKIAMTILSGIIAVVTLGGVHVWANFRIAHRQPPYEAPVASIVHVAGGILSPPGIVTAAAASAEQLGPNPFAEHIERINRLREKIVKGPMALGKEGYLYGEYYKAYFGSLDSAQSVLQKKETPDALGATSQGRSLVTDCIRLVTIAKDSLVCDLEKIPDQYKSQYAEILGELNEIIAGLEHHLQLFQPPTAH